MGGRDHSIECETCGVYRGGLNDLKCFCDDGGVPDVEPTWMGTPQQADAARALLDSLIYQRRDFDSAWEAACLHWGRFGEVPARIAILESALMEVCEIALSGTKNDDRIRSILSMVRNDVNRV